MPNDMPKILSNSILSNIGDSIVSVDTDLRIVFVNEAANRIFHLERDVVGMHADDVIRLVRTSDEEEQVDPFRDVLSSGEEKRYNHPMRVDLPDGDVYVEDSASPVRNEDGEIIGVVAIFRDVTEQVRLITYARLANERYVALFESSRSGISVYKSDDGENFVILDLNTSAENMEKTKRYDVVGKNVQEVFKGVENMKLMDAFRRVWKTGKSEHLPCSWYEDGVRNGWRDNYIYKLPTGEIVAVYDDVTDKRIQAEKISDNIAKLRDHETRFKNLFDNSPIPTISAGESPTYIINDVNSAFCKMIGYTPVELIGKKSPTDFTHPGDVEASLKAVGVVRSDPSGKATSLKLRFVCKNGNIKKCICHISKVVNSNGNIDHFAQIIDITNQEQIAVEKDKLLATINSHRKIISRTNSILSAECDIARRMINGKDHSLEKVIATAGKKLGVKWLCVASVGLSKILGRWADDGKSSTSSVVEDFRVDEKDVFNIRGWINTNLPYVGNWNGLPPFLSKLAKKAEGNWLVIPVPGQDNKCQAGIVMMVSKDDKQWESEEVNAIVGLATLLCVLARSEKNHGELSRKIEETIAELSKTIENAGPPNA